MTDAKRWEHVGLATFDAIVILEEATLVHMGPRERGRLVGWKSLGLSADVRKGILSAARRTNLDLHSIVATWNDVRDLERAA